MSFGQSKEPDTSGITDQGAAITKASGMSGATQAAQQSAAQLSPQLQQLYSYQAGIGQAPQGYQSAEQQYQNQGPLAQSAYNQAMQQMQPGSYQSTLQPQLQLVQNSINQQMQQRGLLNSGLDIENMGRAGAELAVNEANSQLAYQQQAMQNATGISQQANSTQQQGQSNLGNFYGQQQQYGMQGQNLASQGAQQAAQYNAYPSQAALGSYYGNQAGNQSGLYGLGGAAIGAGGALGAASIMGGAAASAPLASAGTGLAAKAMIMCIPEGTAIDTKEGIKPVEEVRAGDIVFDKDDKLSKVLMKYEFDEKPTTDRFIELDFNGKKLIVCDMHKIDGVRAKDLDIPKKFVEMNTRSYDLLTDGRNGSYRSNGIGIDSMIPELHQLTKELQEA